MVKMKPMHSAVKALFEVAKSTSPLSESTLSEVKSLIQEISVIVEARRPEEISINTQDDVGNTALIFAAFQGHDVIVDELIKANADLNIQGQNGNNTALLWAAYRGHDSIVDKLIKAGADLDIQNEYGYNALMMAASQGREAVVHKLIKANAKLEILDRYPYGKTALDIAIETKKLATVSLLLSHGAHVQDRHNLVNFLKSCDQQDPDVLASLKCLYKQLNYRSVVSGIGALEEKQITAQIAERETAQLYMKKLDELHAAYKKLCFFSTDEATNKSLPAAIIRLITDYDDRRHCSAQSPIVFFQPTTVDSHLRDLRTALIEQTERTRELSSSNSYNS